MRNVEIKAHIKDFDKTIATAKQLSGSPGTSISQHDVFYDVHNGRLKLRFEDGSTTLVQYDRCDQKEAKLSNYELLRFSPSEGERSQTLHTMLSKSMGVVGNVYKKRYLFIVGQTRIHVDNVKDLGSFLELEVVLEPNQTLEDGKAIAKELQDKLYIKDEDLINCAYMDLLLEKIKHDN